MERKPNRKRSSALRRCLAALSLLALLTGCHSSPAVPDAAVCSPDYAGVTVPHNIAPLNFCLDGDALRRARVRVEGEETSLSVKARGGRVMFPERRWHRLLEAEKGHTLQVTVRGRGEAGCSFAFDVSEDAMDGYVTYRLIDPSFEVWHKVEIRERDLTGFGERVLSDWKHTDNSCMNCHTHANARGDLSFFHLRGADGGTILNRAGTLRKLTLKTDSMPVAATYGDLHPSGRFAVYTWNSVIPSLRALGSHRMEIYDTASDLLVADFDQNRLLTSPLTSGSDVLETFPTFAPDGRSITYCRALNNALPDSIEHVRYSLVRIAFDAESGCQGDSIETLWNGDERGGSASFPKYSPDGRFLLFCRSDFGTFPIWHRETRLVMIDLTTGEELPLDALADANASSTYHSWSSNGRWIAFASKRGDGQYGRVWFAHVDEDGNVTRPFVLPQRDPEHDRLFMRSFNIPDLGNAPVPFDAHTIGKLRKEVEAEVFE